MASIGILCQYIADELKALINPIISSDTKLISANTIFAFVAFANIS